MQLNHINKWGVYAVALLFVAINALCIYNEFFLFCLLPIALLLVAAVFLSLDKLMLCISFLTPLSIPLSEIAKGLPIDMYLPTEPLLAGVTLVFLVKMLYEKQFDKRVLTHPISITIYIYVSWILVTSITSVEPLVSFKFLVARLWFILPLYFLMTQIFRNPNNARRYVLLYAISLCVVVLYALTRHATYGIFDQKIAHWASNPFYKDHTSYGALLAMNIPPIIALLFEKNISRQKRFAYLVVLSILCVGLIFSYSRAAWLSLVGAFGVWCCIKLRIKFSFIAFVIITTAIVAVSFGDSLTRALQSNNQDSSTTSIVDHVKSMSNVSTDASNVERINRWKCALRMFVEKPVLGWGPGTYMFYYAPYQISYEKTIISTNEGDKGNAHSEYLGPLCESGILGPITLMAIIVTTIITAIKTYRRKKDDEEINKLTNIALAVLIGLFTYYFHGVLNDFLDTDKASVPFWGYTALIVAVDIYNNKLNKSI